tara:strand:- start:205 stop:453 length:249 start_codon:yes stop_codon:yes gene_type:complete
LLKEALALQDPRSPALSLQLTFGFPEITGNRNVLVSVPVAGGLLNNTQSYATGENIIVMRSFQSFSSAFIVYAKRLTLTDNV